MKVSYNWLREFVDFNASPEEIAQIITFQCFELEELVPVRRHVRGVVVGKIIAVEKHPDADRLQVTRVDIGAGAPLSIICGAPNCREGIVVPVAPPGTRVGEITVERRKIRGVSSEGMILSEREMGITDDHSGVLELTSGTPLGSEMSELVEPEDTILDFEITVNRPDGMSHLGVAREIAAHFRLPLKTPPLDVLETDPPVSDLVRVEIADPDLGPRYTARIVSGVKVRPSPLWMKARLHSLGQRPINNVVDITNFVLMELGHPLHAFDFRLVHDGKVIVRRARDAELFTTLDGQKRKLTGEDLMIADPAGGIALAGVMGGENSEIREDTGDVLIEAAYFNPVAIRKTSKRLGLSTEASRRFERGADPSMTSVAALRCARLLAEFAGAEIFRGEVDAYPSPIPPKTISLRPSRVNHVLGVNISEGETAGALEALQLEVEKGSDGELKVTVPMFRPDLEREIDLVEEVARIVGYNKVPDATHSRIVLDVPETPFEDAVDAAVDTLVGLGFHEAICSSMVSGEDQKAFHPGILPPVITHPLSPEMNSYRSSLLPGLLRVLQRNLDHDVEDMRLFEVGQVGGKGWLGNDDRQRTDTAFVVTGCMRPPSFDRPAETYDLFDLKGDVFGLLSGLSLDKTLNFSYDTPENLEYGFLLQGENNEPILIGGLLKKEIADAFGIERQVFVLEADLEKLTAMKKRKLKRPGASGDYRRFSRFPASEKDLAFLVEAGVACETIEKALRKTGGDTLENVSLLDLYRGKPLSEDQRSLTYHLVFRSSERTLTDKEVHSVIRRMIAEVEKIPGVKLRT